jgi:hypothetical protein
MAADQPVKREIPRCTSVLRHTGQQRKRHCQEPRLEKGHPFLSQGRRRQFPFQAKGINHYWSNTVRVMNTQNGAAVTVQDKDDQKIYIRKCSRPETKACEIYEAQSNKHQPRIKKIGVTRKTNPKN